jgi:hypothetical protein
MSEFANLASFGHLQRFPGRLFSSAPISHVNCSRTSSRLPISVLQAWAMPVPMSRVGQWRRAFTTAWTRTPKGAPTMILSIDYKKVKRCRSHYYGIALFSRHENDKLTRPARVFVEGGIYHVYNRLGRGERVFAAEHEAEEFTRILKEVAERDDLTVMAWCLLSNHYHLAVRSGEVSLGRSLRSLRRRWVQVETGGRCRYLCLEGIGVTRARRAGPSLQQPRR